MKICILQSSYQHTKSIFKDIDPPQNPLNWLRHPLKHTFDVIPIDKANSVLQIKDLKQKKYDVAINLCDGAWDEDKAGAEVLDALEFFGIPYTGSDKYFYSITKEKMKMLALYYEVPTPNYIFIYDLNEDLPIAIKNLKYPLIVKHYNGYNSIGMTRDSKVNNDEQLLTQSKIFLEKFGGVLVEEFIPGREVTVLVVENPDDPLKPIVLKPIECIFPEGENFKHFDLKWLDYDSIKWKTLDDKKLVEKLIRMTQTLFVAMNGVKCYLLFFYNKIK